MKRTAGIIGAIAGAAAIATILLYKRKDGSRLGDRLFHIHGPHGEPVYVDMYERQFYENQNGQRVYLNE